MKTLFLAAALFAATATAAFAQPAYDASQGPAPSDYPVCSHHGQDRCVQPKHAEHRHHGKKHAEKEAAKGERG